MQLIFRDDGKGMAPEISEHIFEKYFTTRGLSGGSGVGLSVVKNIVETVLFGEIQCVTSPGSGCEFSIDFPVLVIVSQYPQQFKKIG